MNIKIPKKRAVEAVILFFALCLILAAGPLGVLDQSRVTAVNQTVGGQTEPAGENERIQQVFLADGGYLEKLSVYSYNDMYRRPFLLTIYDETGEILFYQRVAPERHEIPGYITIPVEFQTVKDRAYVWEISHSAEEAVVLGWQNTAEAGIGGLGNYYYVVGRDDIREQIGQNVLMHLTYADPMSTVGKAGLCVGIAAVAAFLVLLVENFFRRQKKTKWVRIQWALQWMCNPLIGLGTGYLLYLVHTGFYRSERPDRIIYTAGILLFAGFLAYAVNAGREKGTVRKLSEIDWIGLLEDRLPDVLQSLFWAGALWGCIDYMNAMYNIYQDYAYRKTLLFFGLAILMMCVRQDWLRRPKVNWCSLIWIAASSAAGIIWYRVTNREWFAAGGAKVLAENSAPGKMSAEQLQALNHLAEQAKLSRWNAVLFVVIGLVVIQLGLILWKKKADWRKLAVPYCGLILLLFVLLNVFRNTRGWTINLAVSFTVMYLFYLAWDKRERFLGILCSGIILNFVFALVFALLRRPFRAWYFYRYNFVFHTVTVTAAYLTLVLCALFVRLLMKYQENRRLCTWWGTGLLFGMASSLLIMTLSRTGYLAAVVMGAVMLIYVSLVCYRETWKKFLVKTGTLLLLMLLSFPVTYSSLLLIAPHYDDPYIFDLENAEEEWAIHKGYPANSENYITFSRFAYCFDEKLFGERRVLQSLVDTFMAEKKEMLVSDRGAAVPENFCAGSGEEILLWTEQSVLLASADEAASGIADLADNEEAVPPAPEDGEDFSNGRLDIFRSYIKHWNLTGHDEMGVELPDGSLGVHAHNTYLQVIHDHGLITGGVYLLVGIVSLIWMFRYSLTHLRMAEKRNADPYAALPLAIFLAFAVAGLVEWLFHPCNPLGFSTMAVLAPLMTYKRKK